MLRSIHSGDDFVHARRPARRRCLFLAAMVLAALAVVPAASASTLTFQTARVSKLKISPNGMRTVKKGTHKAGAKISYTLNVAAKVRFAVERKSTGRKVKHGKKTTCHRPVGRELREARERQASDGASAEGRNCPCRTMTIAGRRFR